MIATYEQEIFPPPAEPPPLFDDETVDWDEAEAVGNAALVWRQT